MSLGKQLRARRIEMNLTRSQLAQELHITPSAVANYENGISSPKTDILISLMLALDVDANYLFQDYLNNHTIQSLYGEKLSAEEKDAITKYRCLTEGGKHLVRTVIYEEYERLMKITPTSLPCYQPGKRKSNSGFILLENPQTIRLTNKQVPQGTDYCFQIQIDGYEPVFRKYDVIALSKSPAQHNQMGIFCLNGVYYIRTLSCTGTPCLLCSLNVMDPDIEVSAEDDFTCLGKVLGKIYGSFEIFNE